MDNDDHGADETVQDVSDETDQVTPNTWKETNVRFETQKDLFQVSILIVLLDLVRHSVTPVIVRP